MPTPEHHADRPGERRKLFDGWAHDYDRAVGRIAATEDFPFAGYDAALDAICDACDRGSAVLDLGTGTGALARRLIDAGCRVTATDLSPEMLAHARARIPEAHLVEASLTDPWPAEIDGPYGRIVSSYVLHEFDLQVKIDILRRAAERLKPAGTILIADVAFPTVAARAGAQNRWRDRWDPEEFYWAADEAIGAAEAAGLAADFVEVSVCAGLFTFRPAG